MTNANGAYKSKYAGAHELTFHEYQDATATTAVYPGRGCTGGLVYVALGLAGEAGEIANKVKKIIRDDEGHITPEKAEEIRKELGDVLWYVSQVANELNTSLTYTAGENLDKLADRKIRGVLHGSGDNR
jgi:NTP pyrophosphatase (non-canonical NTP hydrolase)